MTTKLDLSGFPAADWEDWRREVEKGLRGARFEDRLVAATEDGIAIQPLFTAEHPRTEAPETLPGHFPFRRGGSGNAPWQSIAVLDDPSSEGSLNAQISASKRDADGFWLRFNAVDRAGEAPAESAGGDGFPREALEQASDGLPIIEASDLESLLEGVDLTQKSLFLDGGAAAVGSVGLLLEVARRRGLAPKDLKGCLGIDPLGTEAALARGADRVLEDFRQLSEVALWSQQKAPQLRSALISMEVYHDAGASPVEELALALASGAEVMRRLSEEGLSPEASASQLLFSFSVDSDLFGNIAKLRAARQLWASVLEAWGVPRPKATMLLRAEGSRRSRTAYGRAVNALRGTAETFAAVVGGADLVSTLRYDAAVSSGRPFSRRLAINTQQILRHESHLARTRDPAGGSWYVEWLTEELSRRAWALFQSIEGRGGMLSCLCEGLVAERISATADRRGRRVAFRRDSITGVNEFPSLSEPPAQPAYDPDAACTYLRRRGSAAAGPGITTAAPPELAAAAAQGACLAELAGLTEAPAATSETASRPRLKLQRKSEGYEELRRRGEAYGEAQGHRPRVFVAGLGSPAEYRPRASYLRDLLATGGVEAVFDEELTDPDSLVAAFKDSPLAIVALCGADETYLQQVAQLTPRLQEAGALRIILVGHPADHEMQLRMAGVDSFIFAGCDVLDFLKRLYLDLEATA